MYLATREFMHPHPRSHFLPFPGRGGSEHQIFIKRNSSLPVFIVFKNPKTLRWCQSHVWCGMPLTLSIIPTICPSSNEVFVQRDAVVEASFSDRTSTDRRKSPSMLISTLCQGIGGWSQCDLSQVKMKLLPGECERWLLWNDCVNVSPLRMRHPIYKTLIDSFWI